MIIILDIVSGVVETYLAFDIFFVIHTQHILFLTAKPDNLRVPTVQGHYDIEEVRVYLFKSLQNVG